MKYKKARDIIDQVAEDLSSYDDQGLIDYTKLYKVIRKCNADLGERINPEKAEVIDIKGFKGYLPEDFLSLNYALLCHTKEYNVSTPRGFQVEYKTLCEGKKSCHPCVSDCDGDYAIYQLLDDNWTQFKQVEVARVTPKSFKYCQNNCPNMFMNTTKEFDIQADGSVVTTFENGYLYVNYVGSLEDEDGDLLVIDHPLVEGYYENEVIKKIMKFLVYNKEADVVQIYQDSLRESGRARKQAFDFVNMIGYEELTDTMKANRNRMYHRFFQPFE